MNDPYDAAVYALADNVPLAQLICFNVQACLNHAPWSWEDKRTWIDWYVRHTYPPAQAKWAIDNGWPPLSDQRHRQTGQPAIGCAYTD